MFLKIHCISQVDFIIYITVLNDEKNTLQGLKCRSVFTE